MTTSFSMSLAARLLRALLSWLVVLAFLFPIGWWALSSFKPYSAIFTRSPVYTEFNPTLANYAVTLGGKSRTEVLVEQGGDVGSGSGGASSYFSIPSIVQSAVVALCSTLLATFFATLTAFALSRLPMRGKQHFIFWVLSQRMMPPVAVAIPLFFMFRDLGLRDTLSGLILVHALMNLPLATLLMKSFFDDVPRDVDEAAMLDGASRLQTFWKVVLPLARGGLAASAVLCFVFSWTEFLLSLQLTSSIRTVPVKISSFVTSTGTEWGFITALGTAAMLPSFLFILLVQKHLVRGLTLGSCKD